MSNTDAGVFGFVITVLVLITVFISYAAGYASGVSNAQGDYDLALSATAPDRQLCIVRGSAVECHYGTRAP